MSYKHYSHDWCDKDHDRHDDHDRKSYSRSNDKKDCK